MSEEQSTTIVEEEVKQETNNLPELWNPNIASWLSLLLTPIFSSWIISRNWKTLGDEKKAQQGLYWIMGLTVFYLVFIIFFPNAAINSSGICILWFICYGYRQYLYVKDVLKGEYKPKSWGNPILKGLGVLAVIIAIWIPSNAYHNKKQKQKMISATAMSIINNKIVKDYERRTGRKLECVKLELKEEFADDNYFANVVFSNGDKQKATVQYKKDNDTVIVQFK